MGAMETKTQAQLEELLGTIVEFMKQKDPGLSGMLEPELVSCDFEKRSALIRYRKKTGRRTTEERCTGALRQACSMWRWE